MVFLLTKTFRYEEQAGCFPLPAMAFYRLVRSLNLPLKPRAVIGKSNRRAKAEKGGIFYNNMK
jgi:hypothetical protein